MPRPIRNVSKPTAARAAELPKVKASKLFSPRSSALDGKRVVLDDSLKFGFTSSHGPSFSITREGGKKKGDEAFTLQNEYAVMTRTNAFETNLSVVLPEDLKKGDVFKVKTKGCSFELEIGLDVKKYRAQEAKREPGWKAGGSKPARSSEREGAGSAAWRGVAGRDSSDVAPRPRGGVGGGGSGGSWRGGSVGGGGSGGGVPY